MTSPENLKVARARVEVIIAKAIFDSTDANGPDAGLEAAAIVDALIATPNRWAIAVLVREASETEPELPLEEGR